MNESGGVPVVRLVVWLWVVLSSVCRFESCCCRPTVHSNTIGS